MSMPETAIHEDADLVATSQDNVWFSGHRLHINDEPESLMPEEPPHHHLRLRILAVDSRHVVMSLFCGHLFVFQQFNDLLVGRQPVHRVEFLHSQPPCIFMFEQREVNGCNYIYRFHKVIQNFQHFSILIGTTATPSSLM